MSKTFLLRLIERQLEKIMEYEPKMHKTTEINRNMDTTDLDYDHSVYSQRQWYLGPKNTCIRLP